MRVLRSISEVKEWRDTVQSVALVPTMGAFHDGHLALMTRGKELCESVAVSLFVNPLQFGEGEDLSRYPKQEAEDLAMAESVGVDMVYVPTADQLTGDILTTVSVRGVTTYWEGEKRPGHFDGVATIVSKLFHIVQPDIAVFGLKDLQQCALIQRMVTDLNFSLKLDFLETIREPSGLAMSSRNRYFDEASRVEAAGLHSVLAECVSALRTGANWVQIQDGAVQKLMDNGFDIEYLALVDAKTMRKIDELNEHARIITAARFRNVRLIDNIAV